ncbi:MAG: hypothetical protein WCT10_02690 [Patescibacteria group bacterium]|jgi:phage shock protein A
MFAIIAWCLFVAAAFIALISYQDRLELRDQLKSAQERSEHWEKEAKALGWKNPFEQVAESLNNTVDQLRKTAEVMEKARLAQAESTAKLKKLAEACKQVTDQMRARRESLAAAKRQHDGRAEARPADSKTAPRTTAGVRVVPSIIPSKLLN